ncbi:hypothetical protein GCM10027088_63760 [Nocardia goodfellowii]
MAITLTRAKVLVVLAILEPTEALTVRQLCATTGFAEGTIRQGLRESTYEGLAACSRRQPPGWRITAKGRLLMGTRLFQDMLPPFFRDQIPPQAESVTANGVPR